MDLSRCKVIALIQSPASNLEKFLVPDMDNHTKVLTLSKGHVITLRVLGFAALRGSRLPNPSLIFSRVIDRALHDDE